MAAEADTRTLRVDVSIPEDKVAQLFAVNVSPTAFVQFVFDTLPFDEWVSEFRSSERGGAEKRARQSPTESSLVEADAALRQVDWMYAYRSRAHLRDLSPGSRSEPWSEEAFVQFLNVVAAGKDFNEPLSLLAAYSSCGPTPTSSDLQRMCGFKTERRWQEKLRVTKTRLTVQARKMGRPPIFPRAQTTEAGRQHPMDPSLYSWLKAWFEAKEGRAPNPQNWGPRIESEPRAQGE